MPVAVLPPPHQEGIMTTPSNLALLRLFGTFAGFLHPASRWMKAWTLNSVSVRPLIQKDKHAMEEVVNDAFRTTDDPYYPLARGIAGELQTIHDELWAHPKKVHPPMRVFLHHGSATEYHSVPLVFRRRSTTATGYEYCMGTYEEVIDTTEGRTLTCSWSIPIEEGWEYMPLLPVHWAEWGGLL